jgi:putative FmdB family regulatory protein
MPTYEYTCLKCGTEFEAFQPMKDAPLKVCTCGKKGKVRRNISAGAGLIFKGTGFYQTDYKKTSSPSSASSKESVKAPAPPTPTKTES